MYGPTSEQAMTTNHKDNGTCIIRILTRILGVIAGCPLSLSQVLHTTNKSIKLWNHSTIFG